MIMRSQYCTSAPEGGPVSQRGCEYELHVHLYIDTTPQMLTTRLFNHKKVYSRAQAHKRGLSEVARIRVHQHFYEKEGYIVLSQRPKEAGPVAGAAP